MIKILFCISIILIAIGDEMKRRRPSFKKIDTPVVLINIGLGISGLTFLLIGCMFLYSCYACLTGFGGRKEEWLDANEIEQEIEKKWNIEVEFLSTELHSDGESMIWNFEDLNGLRFIVLGRRYGLGKIQCEYYDNYNVQYIYAHAEDFFKPLNEEGFDVKPYKFRLHYGGYREFYGVEYDYYANIPNYEMLDTFFDVIEEINLELESEESYITDVESRLGLRHEDILFSDNIYSVYDEIDEENSRKEYIRLVLNGDIEEKLPDDVIEKYFPNES